MNTEHPVTLDDARLAPAEELQAEPFPPLPPNKYAEAIGTVLGWALLCAVAVALVLTLINHAPKG